MTTATHDGLVSCITRWLPVLDEPELRAVEGFVLELVIAARERQIDLSACGAAANLPAVPHGTPAPQADAFSHRRGPGLKPETPIPSNGHGKSSSVVGRESGAETVGGELSPVERGLRELRDAPAPLDEVVERIRAFGGTPDRVYIRPEHLDAVLAAGLDVEIVIDDPDATWPRQQFDVSDAGDES